MENISINLLPEEFTAEEVKKSKFYKIQTLGISLILLAIFLSIVTISLRIFQSNRIKLVQLQASESENKVTALSSKQASLILLKNRIDAINQYFGKSSKQTEMLNLVDSLLPPLLQVNSVSVGGEGTVVISALVPDVTTLDRLFTDLLSNEKNENKIAKVSVEALNRGRDSLFRVSFTVEPKK